MEGRKHELKKQEKLCFYPFGDQGAKGRECSQKAGPGYGVIMLQEIIAGWPIKREPIQSLHAPMTNPQRKRKFITCYSES